MRFVIALLAYIAVSAIAGAFQAPPLVALATGLAAPLLVLKFWPRGSGRT